MAAERAVKVPDIGDFDQVEVIEVLVSAGDEVAQEQSLITLESDKATMEIPAPYAGVVKEIAVAVVPNPQLLPKSLEIDSSKNEALLLVGDLNYGGITSVASSINRSKS